MTLSYESGLDNFKMQQHAKSKISLFEMCPYTYRHTHTHTHTAPAARWRSKLDSN